MSIQSEADVVIMSNYPTATVADLERGIANAERMEKQIGCIYCPGRAERDQVSALRKHAALLRQEPKRRQAVKAEAK